MAWLRQLRFEQVAQESTRLDYLHEIEHMEERVKRLEQAIGTRAEAACNIESVKICLRLVSALLIETSQQWMGTLYLRMEEDTATVTHAQAAWGANSLREQVPSTNKNNQQLPQGMTIYSTFRT